MIEPRALDNPGVKITEEKDYFWIGDSNLKKEESPVYEFRNRALDKRNNNLIKKFKRIIPDS